MIVDTLLSFNDKVDHMEIVIYTRDTNSSFKSEVRLKMDELQLTAIKKAIDNFLARNIDNESERSN